MPGFPAALARTAAFALAYLAAAYAGRLTVLDGTNLSLVWPAAGVAVVWFAALRRSPWPLLDPLALAAVTLVANVATGAALPLATAFAVANIVQTKLCVAILERLCPHLWGAGGRAPMARLGDLWGLAIAAAASTAAGAAIGPTAVWLIGNGSYSPWTTGVWLTRNTVSVLLIAAIGLRIGARLAARPPGRPRLPRLPHPRRLVEGAALVACSTVVYVVGFAVADRLPVAFLLLGVTIWAALRFSTSFVLGHDLAVGAIAVLFTLRGDGPFAAIGDFTARALVAQAFVGMVAVVGLALALGRDEKAALVAQLTRARQEAGAQAGLLTAIIDSMSDGVGVLDATGRFVVRNPAATALLGRPGAPPERVGDYDLYRPDGAPLAGVDLAYVRALAGEDVPAMDVLVRNAPAPDRILNVRATALPATADRDARAVIVFTDVTADRRHRDELTAFAGVVAHDLLNPLATIDGWTEFLADVVAETPDHPATAEVRTSVNRIRRAGVRMRDLINDLLDHSTATEAALAPTDVELADLVADVRATRGGPATYHVDALPAVHADPRLVRQLLDQLIDNAVTYATPGTTPHVGISATAADDGLVAVRVSDNGIGIPAGQHGAIFGNFHRAHPDVEVAGSGLGLAICQRIVERHGGTISAADNPGGGARITFTLPVAASR
ncbi:hypothetical protein GCM10010123_41160 [Pilimelia anulata]|uniref:Sensor-like histidine kinase SenX3 n=1 Tax=Pilimelia anulata TaxID=53371 RepID=A0A8J3BGY5_9ACTN|nr:ATP-binding protein [Pilimelia anulata]GGK07113.1 hypothetical protein GCM10010123_41160 [Pilimelia anulata]